MSTIIMIPGMWRSGGLPDLAESLRRDGHEIVTVSLPGSDAIERGRHSWNDAVAAVEEVIDALPAGVVPHLIGESTGGLLALAVASRRPTGPVVLLNSPSPLRGWRSPLFFLYAAARQAFGHSYRGTFREIFLRGSKAAPAPAVPVLIRTSERDLLVSRTSSLDLLAHCPQADYQRCEADSPEKRGRDVADWIAALEEESVPGPATVERRTLHHDAPTLVRRTPVRIPFTPVRSPLRRSLPTTGRRDRSAGAVAD